MRVLYGRYGVYGAYGSYGHRGRECGVSCACSISLVSSSELENVQLYFSERGPALATKSKKQKATTRTRLFRRQPTLPEKTLARRTCVPGSTCACSSSLAGRGRRHKSSGGTREARTTRGSGRMDGQDAPGRTWHTSRLADWPAGRLADVGEYSEGSTVADGLAGWAYTTAHSGYFDVAATGSIRLPTAIAGPV